MRCTLDSEWMLIAREFHRPARLQSRIDKESRRHGKFKRGMRILRMGPHGVASTGVGNRLADHIEQAYLMRSEHPAGLSQIMDIPGERVKMLAETGVEFS